MIKVVSIALSVVMIALGIVLMYFSGRHTRKSLGVPLLSKHGKAFFGGTLAFFGLMLLAIALIRV